jgi:uncharacterized protein (TIGR03437 family)
MRNRLLILAALVIAVTGMLALLIREDSKKQASQRFDAEMEAETEGSEGGQGGYSQWFYDQRAYPATEIPAGARLRAVEQLDRLERRRRLQGYDNGDPVGQRVWASIGPAPISNGSVFSPPSVAASGRVSAIALDPGYNGTTNQTLYVGGAQGGVWKSIDNGANWTPLIENEASLAIGTIVIDPTNPNTIYVGTGEPHRSGDTYYGAGLLKSTNGGATWTLIKGPNGPQNASRPAFVNVAFARMAIHPTNPAIIFAATTSGNASSASGGVTAAPNGGLGIWKSADAGMTWVNVNPDGSNGVQSGHDVLFDPQNPNTVYATVRSRGLYRSTQSGEPGTWQLVTNGLPEGASNPNSPPFFRMIISVGPPIAPSTSNTYYVVAGDPSDSLLGVWRSTDGGSSWTQMTRPQAAGQANYNLALAVDSVDANIIYYGTSSAPFWRSRDGGQTWANQSAGDGLSGGVHADTHVIVASKGNRNIVFEGNDGGLWRTDDGTANTISWKTLNQNLPFTQFQAIALHPTDANIIIGGTQDNGTNKYTGSGAWNNIARGDGGFTIIDQSNPDIYYHTFFNQSGNQVGPRLSLNAGGSWRTVGCFGFTPVAGRTLNVNDRMRFYAPMAQHTGFTGASGNVIYFGTHRLYRTADQGTTWIGLGASTDGFGEDQAPTTGAITTIAAHPQLDNGTTPAGELVWIGTNNGLVKYTANAGALASATFTNTTKAPLPNRYVTDIGLDPGNNQRAVVVYSGFNIVTPTAPGHVFQTATAGSSWTDISGDLPDVPVTSVALDPANTSRIWIGTDIGVFETTNGGTNWVRLSNGMPRVAVFMLRYHTATQTLVAATHGRGLFKLTTARQATSVSAASYSAQAVATEGIAAAFGTGLAVRTEAATTVPLPTRLGGTQVIVRDSAGVERYAPLFFVSANQVNYQIPAGTAPGTANVYFTSDDGTVSAGSAQINNVAPSLFTANASGSGLPAAFIVRVRNGVVTTEALYRFEGSSIVPNPIDLGPAGDTVALVLYGSGVRARSSLSAVSVNVGGANAAVDYAGSVAGLIGLDQINAILPRSLAGRNADVDVLMTVDGRMANTVRVPIK